MTLQLEEASISTRNFTASFAEVFIKISNDFFSFKLLIANKITLSS